MSEILVSLSKPVRPTEKIAWEPELLISENSMSKLGDSFHTGSLVKILAASHADADAKEKAAAGLRQVKDKIRKL